ncbi:hypothetical protein ACETU7_10560 [Rhodococcus sp. 3Y1]
MSAHADEQTSWLEQTINDVRSHLGVVFHRLIESGRIALTVDVFDVEADAPARCAQSVPSTRSGIRAPATPTTLGHLPCRSPVPQ